MQKDLQKAAEADGFTVHVQAKISIEQDYLLRLKSKQMNKKRGELLVMAIDKFLNGGAA